MNRGARWALAAYPPSFRERYGAELAALADDVGPSWRHTLDLYGGAARAWLRPAFTGAEATRGRLEASVATVWVAWCAGFMVAPAVTRALLDPPGPNVDPTVRGLIDASGWVMLAGWVVAMAGVALLGWRSLRPALRARQWSVLRPVLPAVLLAVVDAVGLGAIAFAARSGPPDPTPPMIALGVTWLAGVLALLVCGGIGPAVTIRRLHPDPTVLRLAVWLSAALALCLTGLTATAALAVGLSGRDASVVGTFAPVPVVVVVALAAALTALVSSSRGVRALRVSR